MAYYNVPQRPMPGNGIKADWGRNVSGSFRQVTPINVPGMLVGKTAYGTTLTPIDQGAAAAAYGSVRPFAVRWHGGSKQWQIYLPWGCATVESENVTQSYIPVNDKGKDADGKELLQWYDIKAPDKSDARIGERGGYAAYEWTVYLLLKPWPRMKASTKAEDKDFKASAWSIAIATIYEVDMGDGEVRRGSVALGALEDGVRMKWEVGAWGIRYGMKDADDPESDVKAELVNKYKVIGRMASFDMEPTDVTEFKSVWVVYKHPATRFTMEAKDDLKGAEAQSDDDQTVFKIYDMKDGVVVADYRADIPPMDFYTNAPDTPEDSPESD